MAEVTSGETPMPIARSRVTWTPDEVRSLGLTTDVETAGSVLGIGRTMAYALAKRGEFPVKVLRIGNRYVVPTEALLATLCIERPPLDAAVGS